MMKKAIILLNTNNNTYNAGPKAQVDISNFLTKNGFEKIRLNVNNTSSISKLITAGFVLPRFGKKLGNMDEVIIQYPMSRFLMKNLIKILRKYTQTRIYCVIHDVESLRMKWNDTSFKQDEIALLNSVDGLVVHNENMLSWLKENGLKTKVSLLQLFDYDNPQPLNKEINYGRSICFAGNLAKSTFLRDFHPKTIELSLYGMGLSSKIHDSNIKYQGAYSPTKLPKCLTQSYGLMWDGNSITFCDGVYGQYTKYNAPHKVSLYLSCGIPVIVWRKAGVAKYIVEHKLGIAIDSLTQLDNVLDKISFDEYKILKENCLREAKKLRKGEFINRAIKELETKEM